MCFSSIPIVPQVTWFKLWQGVPRMRYVLCIHYSFAVYILLFNSMVLNISAYGQKHIHMNTVVIGIQLIYVFLFVNLTILHLWQPLAKLLVWPLAYTLFFIPKRNGYGQDC